MNWAEWKSLWRFERDVNIPHASVYAMCPYGFVRVLWHFNRRPFEAWPSQYETGVVLGWRWPWRKKFRERQWMRYQDMPLAIYGAPMDMTYLVRSVKELAMLGENFIKQSSPRLLGELPEVRHIGPTVKVLSQLGPQCDHAFWVANCPDCARKALRLAIQLKTKYEPVKLIDPHEDPIVGFRRREAEAQARLAESANKALPMPEVEK